MEEKAQVSLEGDSSGLVDAFDQAEGAAANLTNKFISLDSAAQKTGAAVSAMSRNLKMAVVASSVGTAAWAAAGVKGFSDLETGMANVSTVADLAAMSLRDMTDGVRDIATSGVPKAVTDLAEGLYDVNSAGFQGAQSLEVLDAAARFAVAGLTDTQTAVQGLVAILNAFSLNAEDATHVSDVLFRTVENGVLTAEEFTMGIGMWSSAAAGVGASFEDASAAIASMTKGSIRAEQAATSLAGIFRQFIKPSEALKDTFAELGYESGQAMVETLGLQGTLEALWQSVDGNITAFGELIPEAEALRGALVLTGSQAQSFAEMSDLLSDRSAVAGATAEAMAKQMDTLSAQVQLAKNQFNEFRITVGELVAPLARMAVTMGGGFFKVINDLPLGLNRVVAALTLMGPAIILVTAVSTALIAKQMLLAKTATLVAGIQGLQGVTLAAQRMVLAYAQAGGAIGLMKGYFSSLIWGSTAARTAMLRATLAVGAWGAALALAGGTILAFRNETQKAKQAINDMTPGDMAGQLRGLQQWGRDLRKVYEENRWIADASGPDKLGKAVWGSMQLANPWADNTIFEAANNFDQAQKMINENWERMNNLANEFSQNSFGETPDLLKDMVINSKELGTALDASASLLADAADAGIVNLTDLVTMVERLNELRYKPDKTTAERAEYDALMKGIDGARQAVYAYGEEQLRTKVKAEQHADAMEQIENLARRSGVAAGNLAQALYTLRDSEADAADKASALRSALELLLTGPLSQASAQARLGDGFRELADALAEGEFSLDQWSERGSRSMGIIQNMADAVIELAMNAYESGQGIAGANSVIQGFIESLWAQQEALGLSNDQMNELIQLMGLTPETIATLVTLPGVDQAIGQIDSVQKGLWSIHGMVAQAAVQVRVAVNAVPEAASFGEAFIGGKLGPRIGPSSAAALNAQANQAVRGVVDNITKGLNTALTAPRISKGGGGGGGRGGGGGGGGGGGSGAAAAAMDRWQATPEQLRAIATAINTPVTNILQSDAFAAAVNTQADRAWLGAVQAAMMQGTNRISAHILYAAHAEGRDPASEMERLSRSYMRAVKEMGEASAQAAIQMFSSVDELEDVVDRFVELRERQRNQEDFMYRQQQMTDAAYIGILRQRLSALEEWSSEWVNIRSQIIEIEEEAADREDRMFRNRREVGVVSNADYRQYLQRRLAMFEQYSDEWMAIWRELQEAEKQTADTTRNWTEQIADAFRQTFDSFRDPIIRATSLISAFGSEAMTTMEQVRGFYEHQVEGTRRWTETIKQLQAMGANSDFIRDLVSQGPGSLGFAESILRMGNEGVSFINDSMRAIEDITKGAGIDYANAQIGQAIQQQNNVSLTIGTIDLKFDLEGTVLTIDDVRAAIGAALAEATQAITNRTSGSS
jgi:TP901 family phage tail tape measure protein